MAQAVADEDWVDFLRPFEDLHERAGEALVNEMGVAMEAARMDEEEARLREERAEEWRAEFDWAHVELEAARLQEQQARLLAQAQAEDEEERLLEEVRAALSPDDWWEDDPREEDEVARARADVEAEEHTRLMAQAEEEEVRLREEERAVFWSDEDVDVARLDAQAAEDLFRDVVPVRTVAQEDEEEALLREDARAALWPENRWLEGRGFLDTDEEERLIEVGIEAARYEQEGRLREQGRAALPEDDWLTEEGRGLLGRTFSDDDWLEGHLLVAEEEERAADAGHEADDHARFLADDAWEGLLVAEEEEQSMEAVIEAALIEQDERFREEARAAFTLHEGWPSDPGDELEDQVRALAQADDDDEGQPRDAGAWGIIENDWEEELMAQMGVKIEEVIH